jgi:hypothetical protein
MCLEIQVVANNTTSFLEMLGVCLEVNELHFLIHELKFPRTCSITHGGS